MTSDRTRSDHRSTLYTSTFRYDNVPTRDAFESRALECFKFGRVPVHYAKFSQRDVGSHEGISTSLDSVRSQQPKRILKRTILIVVYLSTRFHA